MYALEAQLVLIQLFTQPADSAHQDNVAMIDVIVEKWFTQEEYSAAKEAGEFSWQDSPATSEPGTPTRKKVVRINPVYPRCMITAEVIVTILRLARLRVSGICLTPPKCPQAIALLRSIRLLARPTLVHCELELR